MAATDRRAKAETTPSDILGLSVSFAIIASGNSVESSREARERLVWLNGWLPAYLKAVFAFERRHWPQTAWLALEEDAGQHLILAAVKRGPSRWRTITDEHAFNWTKAVVRHFVISEAIRRRARSEALFETPDEVSPDSPESQLSFRESTERPISLIRAKISTLVRRRDTPSVLQAFDELVRHTLPTTPADRSEPGHSDARHRQQRRRTRRLVARAAALVCLGLADRAERAEFLAVVAALLGETPAPRTASPRVDKNLSADVTSEAPPTHH